MPFNPDVFSENDFKPTLLTEISTKDASSMNMPLNQKALINLEKNTEIFQSVTSNALANNIITPAAIFQVTNTSHTLNETPSTSTHLSTFDSEVVTQVKSTLTFSKIFQFLNAQLVIKKRKSQQSQIITSSPFKKAFVNCEPTTSQAKKKGYNITNNKHPKKSSLLYFVF